MATTPEQQEQIVGWLRERHGGRWVHGVSDTELFGMAADFIEQRAPAKPEEPEPEEAEAETEERYPKRKR
jgi:hypothetical protein